MNIINSILCLPLTRISHTWCEKCALWASTRSGILELAQDLPFGASKGCLEQGALHRAETFTAIRCGKSGFSTGSPRLLEIRAKQVSKRAVLYARTSADSENEGLKLSILLRLDTSMSGIIGTTEDRSSFVLMPA